MSSVPDAADFQVMADGSTDFTNNVGQHLLEHDVSILLHQCIATVKSSDILTRKSTNGMPVKPNVLPGHGLLLIKVCHDFSRAEFG
jgi:hypothetical protein